MVKVQVRRKNLLWRVYIRGGNDEIMLISETYYSKSNANRAALRIAKELGVEVGAE